VKYQDIMERLTESHVMVIGDPMFDIYHHGTVSRISPEAPVPVFVEHSHYSRAGGAANVVHQLKALGVTATTHFPRQPWTEKHRYLVGSHHLLRIDRDLVKRPSSMPDLVGQDLVILSDYCKGWLTYDLCRHVIDEANRLDIPVVVDPKGTEWRKYQGCQVICPNEVEAQHHEVSDFDTVLFKEGAAGMRLRQGGRIHHIPATAKAVFDVTGAGDTVVAVLGACLAAGATLFEAATISNIAAGYVVGIPGTASCPIDKLLDLVYSYDHEVPDENAERFVPDP
jgi:bifunctional ADP-heptose synthase (sugar kinase/adenylyltransferase)